MTRVKVCMVSSSGGHFTELRLISNNLDKIVKSDLLDVVYITKMAEDTKSIDNTYYMIDSSRNPFKMVINFAQSLYYFLKLQPDVVVTTGAGFAVPFSYIAKIFGKELIVVESFCRISSKSLSARFLYPIASKFYVQSKELLSLWGSKAEYYNFLDSYYKVSFDDFKNAKNIFVTVGSSPYQFNRLIKLIDNLANKYNEKSFFFQIGGSSYIPLNGKFVKYMSNQDYLKKIEESDFVISHAGSGSMISFISKGKPFYVYPRLKEFNEAIDNHQIELYNYYKDNIINDRELKNFGDML